MAKKAMTGILLVAMCGSMLGFGGCLGGNWGKVIRDGALNIGWEFLLDNDAVFDLFQDDFGTGTQYDDRFTPAPTRFEP